MFCLGSVAGLAIHVRVLALGFHVQNIGVAGLARLVAGKLHRSSGNLTNRFAAIVSILPEALGNNVTSNNEKDNKGKNKQPRKSEEMPRILESAHCSPIS